MCFITTEELLTDFKKTMKNNLINSLVLLGVIAAGAIYLSTYIVDKTQYAIEIRLGTPVDILKTPGLKWKVPFVTRIFYVDNRLLTYDADPGSVFTKDKKEMVVDTFSKWKVVDPLKFYETVRSVSGAQSRLDDVIYSQIREVLGRHTLIEIISGNRKEIRMNVTRKARVEAVKFGIEVVDVRVKRADLPEANSLAVYGRMEEERRREAKRYRSEGEERSISIRSAADRDKVKLISEAQRQSEEIRGNAEAKSIKIYAEAYSRDPEFFAFQRSHEVYRNSLNTGTTLLMDSKHPFFQYLKE